MSLANLALEMGQSATDSKEPVDIITFVEAPWGLGQKLYPVQRIILKAYYGIPLDDTTPSVPVSNWRRENPRMMTEAEYLRYLYDNKRSNIREVIPGKIRTELVLSLGRRSGKTHISAAVVAYEVYRLILKGDPQKYYGLPNGNEIQLISIATGKEQASILYKMSAGHFSNCGFYQPYTANSTMSYARFQTPEDIQRYGRHSEDEQAMASIRVSFQPCVAKRLRGAGNFVIVLDEVAHFNDSGQSDAEQIYNAAKPSLAAFSPKDEDKEPIGPVEARLLSISSPLGRQGFFYKKFRQGFSGGQESENLLCIQAPSWEVNPTLEASFLIEQCSDNADTFFTEFGAEFTDRTRGWISPETLLQCVDSQLRPANKAPARSPHFVGLDISSGLSEGDYCAIAIGHITPDYNIMLDFAERIRAGEGAYMGQTRLSAEQIVDWVWGLSRRFYFEAGVFDQWAGQLFEQAFHERGLTQLRSEFFPKQLASQIYSNLKTFFFEKRITLYDWPRREGGHSDLVDELLALQAKTESKYVVAVQAPSGGHDDLSDALARMVWEATQHLGKRKFTAGPTYQNMRGVDPSSLVRSRVKELQRSRFGGSSPERQIHPMDRGRARMLGR